jgi:CheY-like chemotaxis protein
MTTKVLCIEDNPDDITLITLAFRKAGAPVQLDFITDGEKAIAALQNGYSHILPACVLLDIKLPCKSGLEVLEWIRAQPRLRRLPVILLTSSTQPVDIQKAYDLGANSYLVKPAELDSLVELARTIDLYWVRTNIRPEAEV